MLPEARKKKVDALLAEQRRVSFQEGVDVPDTEVMGVMIAQYWEQRGADILKTCLAALEDANYHGLVEHIREEAPHWRLNLD
jgi:hypothetical protein